MVLLCVIPLYRTEFVLENENYVKCGSVSIFIDEKQ